MRGMSQYGAVAAKIRGMRSHLFTPEEYARLAASPSVRDLAIFLKAQPGYSESLAELDPDNMRRENFERLLIHSILLDFGKISHFLDRKQKAFLSIYAMQFDLRLINNLIREMFNKYTDPVDLTIYRTMYLKSKTLDFDRIINAKTIDELIEGLEGTMFAAPVRETRDSLDNATLFDYETALSRFHFTNFWRELDRLNSPFDREILLDVHGTEIDMLNMIWIYRTKAYYNVSPKEIFRYTIPAYHRLKYRDIAKMINSDGVESLMQIIQTTYYRKYVDPQDPSSLERAYASLMTGLHDKARKQYPYSFAVVEAYLFDKRQEVDRIVKIAESIRYGYDSRLILNALNIRGS